MSFLDTLLDKPMKNFRKADPGYDEFADYYAPVQGSEEEDKTQVLDYVKFSQEVARESKERLMKEAIHLISRELSRRHEIRDALNNKGVEWTETKMHETTGYDKYECQFCTDLPYFSVVLYHNKSGLKKEEAQKKSGEFKERDRKRGIKKVYGEQSNMKTFNSCLDHELLMDQIKAMDVSVEFKTRQSDKDLQLALDYAKAQLTISPPAPIQ